MSHKEHVKRVYWLWSKVYDKTRHIWYNLAAKHAEKEFVKLLRGHVKPTSSILELGPGTGINIGYLQDMKFKSYEGFDLSKDMLALSRKKYGHLKKISLKNQDITIFRGKKKYDLIISTYVLSHIYQPSELVNKYYEKHLKNKGAMLLMFLTKPKWYIHFWFYIFERLFGAKYISEEEIHKIKGDKFIKKYSLGHITLIEIKKK